VLEELAKRNDLVNTGLEVFLDEDGAIEITEYDIPQPPHSGW